MAQRDVIFDVVGVELQPGETEPLSHSSP